MKTPGALTGRFFVRPGPSSGAYGLGQYDTARELMDTVDVGGAGHTVFSHMAVLAKDETAGVVVKNAGVAGVVMRCATSPQPNELYKLDGLGLEALPDRESVDS